MNRQRRSQIIAAAIICLWPLFAFPLASDRSKPILIQADRVEINEKTKVSTYVGHVELRQGTLELDADRLEVTRGKETLQRLHATGDPVQFQQQPDNADYLIRGQANELSYRADTATVELKGNAHLWQGKDEFSGNQIVYQLNGNKVHAVGGAANANGRVRAIIHPKKQGGQQ